MAGHLVPPPSKICPFVLAVEPNPTQLPFQKLVQATEKAGAEK